MSAVPIITQLLLAAPEVAALVGDKIFAIQAPQDALRPYVVVHLTDNDDTPLLRGAGRYYRSVIQLDLYSEMSPSGATEVILLGDAIIDALNGVVKASIAGCKDVDVLLGSTDFTESALEANTHRRVIQFNVRWRRAQGVAEPEEPVDPDDDIVFSIVAGSTTRGVGYAGGVHYAGWPAMGTLSGEPIPGNSLQAVASNAQNGSIVAFSGDVRPLLNGRHLFVNGTDYGPGVLYKWDFVSGVTIWNRMADGPVFVSGQTYSIEIKEPDPD